MYGKAFEAMYEGSMIGSGVHVFAVWNYIIAKSRRGYIELNPELVGFILGAKSDEIESAIKFLCKPDPRSRSKKEEGRRLVKEAQFQYRIVNWEYYDKIKSEEERREYNRLKQREYRAIKSSKPLPGEMEYVKALKDGRINEHGESIA